MYHAQKFDMLLEIKLSRFCIFIVITCCNMPQPVSGCVQAKGVFPIVSSSTWLSMIDF